MDVQRQAFEESNNVKPDWSFEFNEDLQQYVALDGEMQLQVDEFNEHWDTFRAGWSACLAQKVAVAEWIKCSDKLPEFKGVWRTSLPLYVQIEGFGVSLAYPCKWMDEPFCWVPANIMCNSDQEYAPVSDKNQLIGVTHWMPSPQEPTHD